MAKVYSIMAESIVFAHAHCFFKNIFRAYPVSQENKVHQV